MLMTGAAGAVLCDMRCSYIPLLLIFLLGVTVASVFFSTTSFSSVHVNCRAF